jgi:beta-1,4-N-acetylglucosaminyltransferase
MEEGCNCVYSRMASKFSIGLLIILAIVLLMVRVLYVIYRCGKPLPKGASQSFTTLIVLGSGKKS